MRTLSYRYYPMKLTWNDLTINFIHINSKTLTEDWIWLVGEHATPVIVSSIGDMFLSNRDGIYWLNVGEGNYEKVANDIEDLKTKMNDNDLANEWFMFDLVNSIKESGLHLTNGKLFSYKKLPIIGGEYEPDNFELTDIEVHFSIAGQIHQQIKDLPDGAKINIKLK